MKHIVSILYYDNHYINNVSFLMFINELIYLCIEIYTNMRATYIYAHTK